MWMKLILLLITSVCAAAVFVKKRSSVMTDESKRILDIFDFSNFDKQEALNYIDRQRFENLIRGKRSKWNVKQNVLNANLTPGNEKCVGKISHDYGNNNIQRKKYDSKITENNKYTGRETLTNDIKLVLNTRSGLELEGKTFEPIHITPTIYGIRRIRNAKPFERMEPKGSVSPKNVRDNDIMENDDADDDDEKDGDDDQFGYNTGDRHEKRRRKKRKKKKRHHWSKWGEWSPCSVTCGKGRKIRWRKCIAKSCASGEIEMGEKSCQLPACSLFDKLFSFLT